MNWKTFRNWSGHELLHAVVRNTILILGAGYLFYGTALAGLPGMVFLPILLKYDYSETERRRREKLELGFREALYAMKSAMHAGYAAENAIKEAESELLPVYGEKSAIVQEFRYMGNELRMRVSVEDVWKNFGERSGIEDIRNFALILRTAKRSGGNLNEIMGNTAELIGKKIQIRHEMQTVIAAKRLEWKVMVFVPPSIILYMKLGFPDFMQYMYGNPVGIVIMTAALACFAAAAAAGSHILAVDI